MSRVGAAPVWTAIRAPRSGSGPNAAAGGFALLAALAAEAGPVSLAAVGTPRRLTYYAGLSAAGAELAGIAAESLQAAVRLAFPGAQPEPGAPLLPSGGAAAGATWWFAEPAGVADGAGGGLARALTDVPDGQAGIASAVLRPAPPRALARLARRATRLERGLGEPEPPALVALLAVLDAISWLVGGALAGEPGGAARYERSATPSEAARARAIGARLEAGLVAVTLRTAWHAPTPAGARAGHDRLAGVLRAAGAASGRGEPAASRLILAGRPAAADGRRGLFTAAEAARLLRLPGDEVTELHQVGAARLAARRPLPADGIALATGNAGGRAEPLGVRVADLARHVCVLGSPGTGKTALLTRLVLGLAERGVGGVVLDPHGDLTTQVLARLPDRRSGAVDVLDPADAERPVPLNPLHLPAGDGAARAQARAVRAAAVVAAFDDHWRLTDAIAPNFHHHLPMALQALIGCGQAALADLPAFLTDRVFRWRVLDRAGDPHLAAHWAAFERLGRGERDQAVRSILNKASAFLADPGLRAAFGDPGPGLRLEAYLDGGRLLLVDLARGRLPEGAAPLLGGLLLTMAHQAAMARQALPEPRRRPAVVVVDEFAELGFAPLGKMINATRKYRVGLVLAGQSLASLAAVDRHLPAHLVGSAATRCVLRVSGDDARTLAAALGVAPADLARLADYECYLGRPSADGPDVASGRLHPPDPPLRDAASGHRLARARRPEVPAGPARLSPAVRDGGEW